jgi:DMSO/TMAO reductase YedYZ molybdopterin-dependent catalytic subunit
VFASGGAGTSVPAEATVDSVTPFITPNADFYRIDTALSFPRISLSSWKVDIHGLVDKPLTLTYNDLLNRPQVERVVTLCCVSNEVGGEYISTATFQGVMLADLLNEAGVKTGAEQVFSTSLDGWTCGFPVSVALDGRDAMIALGMNGEALPLEHGFPARLVVPGLYGYVSATKWLRDIELTTWDAAEGFWVPRGWSRDAPVKTQSRIDVPRSGEQVVAGAAKIAGIAWAQHRGIAKVEVRIDDGAWQEARLGTDVTDDAWRQWVLDWDAKPGKYTIQVRATDKNGDTQTADTAPPDPDGATGYHTRRVKVA